MSVPLSPALKSWQAAFDALPGIDEHKRLAFANFLARGLPTAKTDAWKYTDLRRLAMREFSVAREPAALSAELESLLLPSPPNALRFVIVDGQLSEPLSTALPRGITLSRSATNVIRTEAFELLNSALGSAPIRLDIAANANIETPIYIAHVWTDTAKSLMSHPHVALTLGINAKATLVEHHLGAAAEHNFANSVIHIDVADGATLVHIRLQDDAPGNFNVGMIRAAVSSGASYINHHYLLGGGLSRTDIHVRLAGEGAHTELHGLVFANHTQHLDVRTCIEHQVPNTQSREDYRGIADHRGRVIFNGKVIVAKDAQRTDAAQSSRNLLVSPHAEIDTRPELEIYANDVKCAHGATVGQLDANSLFYLQSRGVGRDEARSLLTQAFATEVIERAPVRSVRDRVLAQLKNRMKTEVGSL
jgi:Fe-S cluster assembly protein SufD